MKYGHIPKELNTALIAPGDYIGMSALLLYKWA
jgi:hypothetical protein